ncbi:GNAT family N-acetyltransferase [Vibrio albus]|uniref:GNAT family N-acetyltransferase n=1 Tax=Vibrio albus TaxID=2200953 RepID=UPI0015E858D7|nr:GNAT family N-acetyltransferase [Vibrio albus]
MTKEQLEFISSFGDLWENRTADIEFFVINNGKEVVGFFLLDKSYSHRYTFSQKHEIGLKNFVIDKQYQRKGYAVSVIKRLFNYIYNAYPDCKSLCAIVNKKNNAAYQCLLKAGFSDSGVQYHGDQYGPEYILRKRV